MSVAPSHLLNALGPAPRIVFEGLAHRGELAGLELAEARDHAAATLALGLLATALAVLGGFAGTFALAALVWDRQDRGLILGLITLAYLAGAGAIAWWAARRLKTWRPLAETRRQLHEDHVCLQDFLPAQHP